MILGVGLGLREELNAHSPHRLLARDSASAVLCCPLHLSNGPHTPCPVLTGWAATDIRTRGRVPWLGTRIRICAPSPHLLGALPDKADLMQDPAMDEELERL